MKVQNFRKSIYDWDKIGAAWNYFGVSDQCLSGLLGIDRGLLRVKSIQRGWKRRGARPVSYYRDNRDRLIKSGGYTADALDKWLDDWEPEWNRILEAAVRSCKAARGE